MRIARSVSILTLCLAGALGLSACETRDGGFITALVPGGGGTSASLTALNVSNAALSPSFDASTTTYSAAVPNTIQTVTVTPSAAAGATVTVNGTPVASGSATPITLAEGANTVTVGVSNNGASTTYTVTINRAPGTP